MIDTIYLEQRAESHPRAQELLERFSKARVIRCDNYTQVFNKKAQNFRLQKQNPALILALKQQGHVLPSPDEYAVGGQHNYYFSHMLNCLYDCRYCFLQGMYQSAHYVLFVNYENFFSAIAERAQTHENISWYFSGYDCDSLALEPVTGFAGAALDFFAKHPKAHLELRSKSTQIRSLLKREPLSNCVVALSVNPQSIVEAEEHKTPSLERRIHALSALQQAGWPVGLRIDPLIYTPDYRDAYRQMFASLFERLDGQNIHSVSLGPFRMPTGFFRKMEKLYPDSRLLATEMQARNGLHSYPERVEREMMQYCEDELLKHIPESAYFPCSGILS